MNNPEYELAIAMVPSSVGGEAIIRALLIPYWSRINSVSDISNFDCNFPIQSTTNEIVAILIDRVNTIAMMENVELSVNPDVNSLDKFIWNLEQIITEVEYCQYIRLTAGDDEDDYSQ